MREVVALENLLVGFAASYGRPGTTVEVSTTEMLTSEDGEQLTAVLDQVSSAVLALVPTSPRESQIDNLVVVFHRDLKMDVVINEAKLRALVTARQTVNAGDLATVDSVADINTAELVGVDVPEDAGVLILLSSRWRRGLFYDFGPLSPDAPVRSSQVFKRTLASLLSRLMFQDRIGLKPGDQDALLAARWFPFIGLPVNRLREMVHHGRAGWRTDDLLEGIVADVRDGIPRLREKIAASAIFQGHLDVINRALQHFCDGDFLSASSMLYPRIEGILRGQHAAVSPGVPPKQKNLAASAVADPASKRHEHSLLIPQLFEAYLNSVYFADFDPRNPQGVSRHTVAHGVAPTTDLDAKAAVLGILIVDQLTFLCG